jgi:hypothetical protein
MAMLDKNGRRFVALVVLAFGAALATNLYLSLGVIQSGHLSAEAVVRMNIASELFSGDSRGYQALINSVLMPPLPTLAALPFLWIDQIGNLPVGTGFYVLTSLLSAMTVGYLVVLGRVLRVTWVIGAVVAVGLLLTPWTPFAAWKGASTTGSLLFATAICAHFTTWLRREARFGEKPQLMSLGLSAIFIAFASTWNPLFLLASLPAAGILAGRATTNQRGAPDEERRVGRLEGLLLVFFTPILYVPGIWLLFNWLIFGGLWWLEGDFFPDVQSLTQTVALVSAILAPILFLWARWRRLSGLLAGFAYCLAVGAMIYLASVPASTQRVATLGRNDSSPAEIQATDQLKQELRESKGGRLILVVGKPGYLIRQSVGADARFIHHNQLDVESVVRDTPGREVYAVLTQEQVDLWKRRMGQERWDRTLLEDERIGQWRIFYCLKRPEGA